MRVPLLNASLTDCVFELERSVTEEEVNKLFDEAANGYLEDILGVEHRPPCFPQISLMTRVHQL